MNKRETWRTSFDFFLSLIGSSVGLGNVWRFPYLCYKNGGGAFLIPYFLSVLCLGVPLLFLEICLGQFMGEGLVGAYGRLCPLMQGTGIAMTCAEVYFSVYYNVIMAWAIYYLFASFTSTLPWASCGNAWNTPACHSAQQVSSNVTAYIAGGNAPPISNMTIADSQSNLTSASTDPVTEYWLNKVLNISDGVESVGGVKWDLALCLLLAWVLVYVCICKGIKSSGRVMYVTATSPFLLLIILMVRGVTLPGAMEGIKFYMLPDWSRLQDAQVWTDAGTQVLFSYSIGHAVLTSLGSYNKYDHNSYRDAIFYCLVNTCTSFLSGFVIFPVLGYMAQQNNLSIQDVASSGPGLAFIAYPKAVAELPIAPLWSIVFFLCLLMLGVDSEFVGVEAFCTSIIDTWPHVLRKGYRKEMFIGATCVVFFLLGLPMVTEGGMYIFLMVDYYIGSNVLLVMVLSQLTAVAYIYGARRFKENIEMMLGFKIGPYMVVSWTVLSPLAAIGLSVLVLTHMDQLTYNQTYEYPLWSVLIGWSMAGVCVVMIPLTAAIKLLTTPGSLFKRLQELTRPRLRAHQLRPDDSPKDLDTTEVKDEHTAITCRSHGHQPSRSYNGEDIPLNKRQNVA